jgi:hypothetical protein
MKNGLTREQKKKKLGNAIKEYRGSTVDGKWVQHPRPAARLRIHHWLEALGLDVAGSLTMIDNFKTHQEYRDWIKQL